MFQKIISASLSPNTESDDVRLALKLLFTPWKWKTGGAVSKVISWFEKTYPHTHAYAYNSGRSAMFALLSSFGITTGDEVLVQSFSCVAVANSVLWTGATPIFIDIDSTLNIDVSDAEKKVTNKTKMIIVQHTLGLPANMKKIQQFALAHNLYLIEDCAHALGARYNGELLGTFGDAAFFSFGRDKVLSSVFGGLAILKSSHKNAVQRIDKFNSSLSDAPLYWIFQQLIHPIIFSVVLPLYTSGIGKGILWLFQKFSLLSFPVYSIEKKGKRPSVFPTRYPDVLAKLLILQLTKLERYNTNRQTISAQYQRHLRGVGHIELCEYPRESIFLRFPVLINNPTRYVKIAKTQGILLGNWYHNAIDPAGVDFTAIGYTPGLCPKAEAYAKRIINLPTNISLREANRVLSIITHE